MTTRVACPECGRDMDPRGERPHLLTHDPVFMEGRFWAQVDRSGGPDACWPWMGRDHHPGGYGRLFWRGRPVRAHRIALGLYLGRDLARNEMACHRCDNPPCCNPAHLFAGSQSENLADMRAKGRQATGARHGSRTHPEAFPGPRYRAAAR